MKRYIRSDRMQIPGEKYEAEDIGPGVLQGHMPDMYFGPAKHKNYQGVPIRDFRNRWRGVDSIDDVKDELDVLLAAFDRIQEIGPEGSEYRINFFNVYEFGNGVDMAFEARDPNFPIWDRYVFNHDNYLDCAIEFRPDEMVGIHDWATKVSFYQKSKQWDDLILDPNILAETFVELQEAFVAEANKRWNTKQATDDTKLNELRGLSTESASSSELTVPVQILYYDDDVTDERTELIDDLEDTLARNNLLEDTNRFIGDIVIKIWNSQTVIRLKPKVKFKQLQVRLGGKTQINMDYLINDLDKYIIDLKKKLQ